MYLEMMEEDIINNDIGFTQEREHSDSLGNIVKFDTGMGIHNIDVNALKHYPDSHLWKQYMKASPQSHTVNRKLSLRRPSNTTVSNQAEPISIACDTKAFCTIANAINIGIVRHDKTVNWQLVMDYCLKLGLPSIAEKCKWAAGHDIKDFIDLIQKNTCRAMDCRQIRSAMHGSHFCETQSVFSYMEDVINMSVGVDFLACKFYKCKFTNVTFHGNFKSCQFIYCTFVNCVFVSSLSSTVEMPCKFAKCTLIDCAFANHVYELSFLVTFDHCYSLRCAFNRSIINTRIIKTKIVECSLNAECAVWSIQYSEFLDCDVDKVMEAAIMDGENNVYQS